MDQDSFEKTFILEKSHVSFHTFASDRNPIELKISR